MLALRCLLLVVATAGVCALATETSKTADATVEDVLLANGTSLADEPEQGDADPEGAFTVPLGSELQEASGDRRAPTKVASHLQISAVEEAELEGIKVSLSSQLGERGEERRQQDVKGSGKGRGGGPKGPKGGHGSRRDGHKGLKMTGHGGKASRKKGGRGQGSKGKTFSVALDSELQVSATSVPLDATVSLVAVSRHPHKSAALQASSPPKASAPAGSEEDDGISKAGEGEIIKVPLDSERQLSASPAAGRGARRNLRGPRLDGALEQQSATVDAKRGGRSGISGHGDGNDRPH